MRNAFQLWLDEQHHITPEARRVFEESVLCSTAQAYSASMLFLYLAFAHVIRDRITASQAPAGIKQPQWDSMQKAVKNDESWDKAVLDYVKMKAPAPVFAINDDTRNQVEYWKYRRNDCAHSKGNLINLSHVEALQAFIMSNLNKFVVIGSKDSLLNKIKLHFNPSHTPWGKSFDHLIKEIDTSLYKSDIKVFIGEVWKELETDPDPWESTHKYEVCFKFISRCLEIGSVEVKQACKDFLLGRPKSKYIFFKEYPTSITYFHDQPALIREIWHDKLFDKGPNGFGLFSHLIKYNLIPADQQQEAFETVFENCKRFAPTDNDDLVLKNSGFYKIVEESILADNFSNFDKYNRIHKLVIRYLINFPITKDIAKAIYTGFDHSNCPFTLRDSLNAFFAKEPAKKDEYLAHVDGDEVDVPSEIPSIS